MEEIILWLFNRIADIVRFSMNFKIYGDLSLFHFVLGFNFLIILFKFYLFFADTALPESINFGVTSFRNAENKKERQAYENKKKADQAYKKSYEYYKENRIRKDWYSKWYRDEMRNK